MRAVPPIRRRRRTLGALVLLVLAVSSVAGPGSVDGAPRTRPALDADVPDPDVVVRGERTLVFSTNSTTARGPMQVPVRRWTAGDGWSLVGDALPEVPTWTTPGRVWAPGVLELAPDRWVLYFASRDRRSGRQCIGRAVASRAVGPYHGDPRPVLCDLDEGGSIDPAPFVDHDGSRWLLWKTEGIPVGRAPSLRSVRLDGRGRPHGPVSVLLRAGGAAWERGIVENPELVHGAGGLVLLYSGGRWSDASYAIGTARCDSPAGPCRRAGGGPAITTDAGRVGPGGASLTVDAAGTPQLVFHAWAPTAGYDSGGARALHTLPVDVDTGRLRPRPERAPVGRADERPVVVLRRAPTPVGAADHVGRFGGAGGQFLGCDLDGDGVDRVLWFDAGVWHRSDRSASDPSSRFRFGRPGDRVSCGDFDGDGADEPVLRRGGTFLLGGSVAQHPDRIDMGRSDEIGVVGDWDGDGDADPGVYDPATGRFRLRAERGSTLEVRFGPRNAVPVVGDWNGDGRTNVGVRVGNAFHLDLVGDGGSAVTVRLGSPESDPLAGRWSADTPTGESIGTAG